jgi:hypothetical protein
MVSRTFGHCQNLSRANQKAQLPAGPIQAHANEFSKERFIGRLREIVAEEAAIA